MAPTTPEEWLPILAERLDLSRPITARLRSYVDGNAPLPEMGKNTRATWEAFQKKARTNFGGIAAQSHANRIRATGVRVGDDPESEASQVARRIARDNRFTMVIGDAVWDMITARTGYLVAGVDEDGHALITSEQPEMFYAEPDPIRPWLARAAIKVARDNVAGKDYAWVWVRGGQWQPFYRESASITRNPFVIVFRWMTNAGGWKPIAPATDFDGMPVWILSRRDGRALIEGSTDTIDRINAGKLQRLVITAMLAFKQRGLKKDKDAPAMPEVDGAGNKIDYSKVFEAAPGALWDLPEGIDIWESAVVDIRPLLEAEKADARDFAAELGTPISMLIPDAANQSATGAAATTAQQVDACQTDIDRIKLAAAAAIVTALRIEGVDFGDQTVEVDFENPAWVTLAEKMDAYTKAISTGMSTQSAQKIYLGWTQDQIDEDERNQRRIAARAALSAVTPDAVPSVA